MGFKEIREKLVEADSQAIAEWEARENNWLQGPVSIEERIAFIEYRRSMLGGAISAILNELIALEQQQQQSSGGD